MAQQVTKIKKLQDPPESSMNPEEQSELALAMWGRLQRYWNCLTEEQDTNGMWASWTWLAEEFLLPEDTAGHTAERILRTQWRGPPVALPTGDAAEHRGRGTQATTYQTRLCPSKKLPTGAGPQDEKDPGTRFHQRLDQAGVYMGQAEGATPCRGAAGDAVAPRSGGLLADGVQEDPTPAGNRWATRGSDPARCRTARHGGGPGRSAGRPRAGGATNGAKGRNGAHPSVEVVGMRCMEPEAG